MATFYETFVNFMLVGLLIFAMLAFMIGVQDENDVSEKIRDNEIINESYYDLDTDLTGFRDKSQAQKSLFESETPTSGFGTILLFSILSVGKVFNGMIMGVFNTLIKLPMAFLGLDIIVVSILSTILILTIVIGLWAVYKLGG